ncbi:rhomboid family intramembrane serine protease [Salinispira pacifica]|uniref:rhomboid family intramembrane serine protease n=1 Tax=Salinispira pacifica TaxID=1307761 RepID=UPI0003FA3564|nr:rhomboid family intramembrane serine protease [Salinispira pacifica]
MTRKNILRRPLPYTHFNATLYIIVLNLVFFLITSFSRDVQITLSMVPALVNRGYLWSFLTYMFVHANFNHILFNMIGLFIFGTQVEHEMGSWEFIMFYLVTGFLAGLLSYGIYILSGIQVVALMGASGALYAVMLAFATYYPNARIFIMGIIPMRSVTLVLVYAGIALINQFGGMNSSVAHMTHLGGFVFAFLYFLIRIGRNPLEAWGLKG